MVAFWAVFAAGKESEPHIPTPRPQLFSGRVYAAGAQLLCAESVCVGVFAQCEHTRRNCTLHALLEAVPNRNQRRVQRVDESCRATVYFYIHRLRQNEHHECDTMDVSVLCGNLQRSLADQHQRLGRVCLHVRHGRCVYSDGKSGAYVI